MNLMTTRRTSMTNRTENTAEAKTLKDILAERYSGSLEWALNGDTCRI